MLLNGQDRQLIIDKYHKIKWLFMLIESIYLFKVKASISKKACSFCSFSFTADLLYI